MEILAMIPSWLLTIILPLLFIFIIFSYTLRSNNRSVHYKLPPNPPKLPIIGNLHQILGKPRHEALWDLSKKYGPIMLFHIGSNPLLVISSPEMAKQIFKTQDHIFCSRPMSQATKRLTYNHSDVVFSPQGDHQREMRKILVSEFLGPKKARFFNHVLVKEIDSMVQLLSTHPPNTVVNINKMLLTTVSGVVCKAGFGMKYREQPIDGLSMQSILEDTMLGLNGSLGDSFPWIGHIIDHLTGWNDKLEKYFSNLDAFIEMIIDENLNRLVAEKSDDDKEFLQTILEMFTKQDASEYALTKNDVKALVMDVLIGGIDTTFVTMVWAMSEIARNHRVMQKLQSEIRDCTGRIQEVNEIDITKMAYLKMVVKETLRLHPPAPLLIPHESFSHCQIGGYDVLPNTNALINAWGMGRDTSTWGENAAEFYPERFENLDVEYGVGNFELVPFGGGRRSCPAMNTAPATIQSVIANLLYWFDWEVPNGMKNEVLDMEEEGSLTVYKKIPLCLVAMKHKWED